ncbi:hypothetical protein B0O99DRAFT_478947, partial [Bisporella sp. PMI_857]
EVGCLLCAIPGFDNTPSRTNQTTHLQSGATLQCCMDDCRAAYPACKSIIFHARYTACYFLDDVAQNSQLVRDEESEFLHWDLDCEV